MSDDLEDDKNSQRANALKVVQLLGLEFPADKAFLKLCERGCDPKQLKYLLTKISLPPIRIKPKNGRKSYTVSLRPMDFQVTALGKFNPRRLESLANKALKLAEEISKLNSTQLMRQIELEGFFSGDEYGNDIRCDPFMLAQSLIFYAREVIPFVLSRKKQIGEKQRPEYTALRKQLHSHIKEKTGKWHDRLVADILAAKLPDADARINENSVKSWREDNGLHD